MKSVFLIYYAFYFLFCLNNDTARVTMNKFIIIKNELIKIKKQASRRAQGGSTASSQPAVGNVQEGAVYRELWTDIR
jgi:hypothetical protein